MSPRERWIAIGVGIAVGAYVFDAALLTPLTTRLNDAEKAIATGTDDEAKARALFANQKRANDLWRQLTGTTLKGDAPSAESQLLNRVKDVAAASGLTLDSLKPEKGERAGDFQRLTYRAATTGTMRQTSKFLDALRTADIPLRITDVQVASRKDGTDDLTMQAGIATIYVLPPEPAKAGVR